MPSVFLISSNTNTEPYPVYPLGMSVIAGALHRAGYEVIQYDMLASGNSLDHLRKTLEKTTPNYVGISIRNVDNVDSFTSHTNKYIQKVRDIINTTKNMNIPVLVGGAGFSLLPEEILDYIGADHGVIGEGEEKMVRLIEGLEKDLEVPRILGPEKGIPGKKLHSPLWAPELLEYYISESGIMNVQTKRGCENRCSYCTYPYLEGKRMRVRPPEHVADEIEMLCSHGADNFFLPTQYSMTVQGTTCW